MKRWIALALISCATLAHAQTSPAKKELVAKLLQLQQPGIENMAKMLAERPVLQLMQQAGQALQQIPPDKREATGKSLQADAQKFVEEAIPVIRERAIKLAPSTVGTMMEEKFSEDELKQLIAWHESPVKKKYEQAGGEMQNAMVQKLLAEAGPVLDPKLQALQQKMGSTLRAAAGASEPGAKSGKPAASGAKPAAKPASK
jgi:hypothetical protein